jgi:hypothetical protein
MKLQYAENSDMCLGDERVVERDAGTWSSAKAYTYAVTSLPAYTPPAPRHFLRVQGTLRTHVCILYSTQTEAISISNGVNLYTTSTKFSSHK